MREAESSRQADLMGSSALCDVCACQLEAPNLIVCGWSNPVTEFIHVVMHVVYCLERTLQRFIEPYISETLLVHVYVHV